MLGLEEVRQLMRKIAEMAKSLDRLLRPLFSATKDRRQPLSRRSDSAGARLCKLLPGHRLKFWTSGFV